MPVTTGHASTRRFLRRASDRIPPTHRGSGRISRTGCVAGVADTAVVAPGTAFSAHTCRSPGSERASHAWKQASGGPRSRTQKSRGASARKGGPSWTRRPDQIRLEATRFGASLLGEEQRELWPSCAFPEGSQVAVSAAPASPPAVLTDSFGAGSLALRGHEATVGGSVALDGR